MLITDVAELSAKERFFYWMDERHKIFVKRQTQPKPPWTDDEVLQSTFFTNPYRENDKTTVWFRENVRNLLRDDPAVLFATVCFRWFNYIPTGQRLATAREGYGIAKSPIGTLKNSLLVNWDAGACLNRLAPVRRAGEQIFTGAFMVNSPPARTKLEAIIERINNVWEQWKDLGPLRRKSAEWHTLQEAQKAISQFPGLGGFMTYEIVTDLRHTSLLQDATDVMTWCNAGPGCIRGIYRVHNKGIVNKSNSTSPPIPPNWLATMQELLEEANKKLKHMPHLEMREIEHSLCEWDKYERVRLSEGKSKRGYKGN